MLGSAISLHNIPWLVIGAVIGLGVLFGRFLCGWVCPLGFFQDMLHKIPFPKFRMPGLFKYLKYVMLFAAVFVVAFLFGSGSPAFFCNFCPASTLQVVLPVMIADHRPYFDFGIAVRFAVLVLFLLLALGSHRGFCKILCPIGALVAVTNRFSLFSIKLDKSRCTDCLKCDENCPMDVRVTASRESGKPVNRNLECIECLKCREVCPTDAVNNSRLLHG